MRSIKPAGQALPLLVLIFALIGCKDDGAGAKSDAAPEAVVVSVTPARAEGVQRSVEVFGTLYGQEDVLISNKVPGKVIAIYKDIGDRVAPGEPLAQLLRNDYQLSLNEKQAALQEALAALGVTDVPPDDFDLESVPAVRRAKLQAQNMKDKLERARQLYEPERLISDQDYADAQVEAQVAQSAYEAALLDARAQLGTARTRKAQVAIAEQALRDTTIRAPRPMGDDAGDGTPAATQPTADASGSKSAPSPGPSFAVAGRFSSEGELNAGLTRMFRLVIDDPLKLKANVPERHVGQIHIGQKVSLRVEAEKRAFDGSVSRINPQIDPANRTFEVEVAVANADHILKPGAFVRGQINTHVQEGVLLVPERAVVSFAGVKKVYGVKDGKAVEIPIQTGVRVGELIEVTSGKGLKAGDPLVVEGVHRMSAGVPVTVRQ